MKKTIACICILFGVLGVRADVRTNYVYVVSNIFNNVYTESIVTQKVKSSHTDFYYTNYVSVVTNVYQTTFRTNVSVNVDVSQTYVNAAANAASNALSFASQSAASATAAGSSASSASSAASRAAASASAASSAASDGLQRINERINWFDLHSGETITVNNYNWTTNIYYAEDSVARAGVERNAADIASLESRVGDNIQQLTTRMGTAERGIAASIAYTTAVSNKLEKSSRSRFKFDYEYMVHYYMMGAWVNVGFFKVDPMSAVLISTDSSGTKKYGYDFVNDSTSQYKMTVSAVYKYVPVSGSPYMVVVGDKGTSDHAVVSSADEEVLYGSGSLVSVSTSYKFSCDVLGGVYSLDVVGDGLTRVSGDLYRPKVKVVLSDGNSAVNTVVMVDGLSSVSNVLASSVSGLRGTVNDHGTSIGSLNTSVSSLDARVTALEQGGANEPHVYVHGSTTYSKIHIYPNEVDDGKVFVDGGAVTQYRITPAYRYPTTTESTWLFEPAYCCTDGGGLRLFYLPNDTKPIQYSSSASNRFIIPEYLYWQNGYMYLKLRTYTGGYYDGGYAIARYSYSTYPKSISSAVSMTLVEKSSGWPNNSVATIQSTKTSGSGVPIWFASDASAYQQAIVNWMVSGK